MASKRLPIVPVDSSAAKIPINANECSHALTKMQGFKVIQDLIGGEIKK
jgi:hypothetical protein